MTLTTKRVYSGGTVKHRYQSLADYLEQTGTKHQELADAAGISVSHVRMFLAGERNFKPQVALRVHRLTGVRLDSLVSEHVLAVCEALSS